MKKMFKNLGRIWKSFKRIDQGFWDELEEGLISGDVSINTADRIITSLKEKAGSRGLESIEDIKKLMRQEVSEILGSGPYSRELSRAEAPPTVYMIVGVNGVGKTSAIAKLAGMMKEDGRTVMLAAADTFRSAAVEQLGHFADVLDIDMVKHRRNSDPGAVVYDCLESALARGTDTVIIDTAGRMQTSYNLMQELKKIRKVVEKKLGRGPDEILLTIDSTTGQNARNQAEIFSRTLDISGLILTKTDSTSRGGIALTIKNDLDIPVKLLTKGEKLEDIQYFDPAAFADSMIV